MASIKVLDTRIGNSLRDSRNQIITDQRYSLNDLVRFIRSEATDITAAGGTVDSLKIYAHGIGHRNEPRPNYYGAELCQENLTVRTVQRLSPLRELSIPLIEMFVCGFARITPGRENQDGDGNILCQMLADVTNARVRAPTCDQIYSATVNRRTGSWTVDFGAWEGLVLIYTPRAGARVDTNPPPN